MRKPERAKTRRKATRKLKDLPAKAPKEAQVKGGYIGETEKNKVSV